MGEKKIDLNTRRRKRISHGFVRSREGLTNPAAEAESFAGRVRGSQGGMGWMVGRLSVLKHPFFLFSRENDCRITLIQLMLQLRFYLSSDG